MRLQSSRNIAELLELHQQRRDEIRHILGALEHMPSARRDEGWMTDLNKWQERLVAETEMVDSLRSRLPS